MKILTTILYENVEFLEMTTLRIFVLELARCPETENYF
jgi:hypothetical protein